MEDKNEIFKKFLRCAIKKNFNSVIAIMQSPEFKRECKELDEVILELNDVQIVYDYILYVKGGRWEAAESILATNSLYSLDYAINTL